MGSVIDLEKEETSYRCDHIKLGIVLINLIGAPISFIFLLIGILRMIFSNKRISFLTSLIILIFSSEIVNTISKMIQIIKYCYPDTRDETHNEGNIDYKYDMDNPRGIICQIQIVLAIFSDYCSLLATLLLSLRCYDVIKNKIRFFDRPKIKNYTITVSILLSLILAIVFLVIDRSRNNTSYRFDVRDRCSYWCWLDHLPSAICFGFYFIILIFIIIFAFKTNHYLSKGYKKLLEENDISYVESHSNEDSKDNSSKYSNLTNEEIKRIQELKLMRIKCYIYPIITIIIWISALTYRILDFAILWPFDHVEEGETADSLNEKEKLYFEEYPSQKVAVQVFLVLHTFISATRGIFYGVSFIVFEERIICNICRKMCLKTPKEEEPNPIVSDSSRISEKNETKFLEDNEDEKNDMEENNGNDKIEMNIK